MPRAVKFDMIWFWKYQGPPWRIVDRKGQACRVVVRGTKNSVLVEFPDGYRVVTSRYAVRSRDAVPRQFKLALDR